MEKRQNGAWLKRQRLQIEMTPEQLGAAIDRTGRFIYYRENGKKYLPRWLEYAVRYLVISRKK